MGALAESNFLQALGWAVLNSLWQMALLWVAYQLLSGIIVKKSAARNAMATFLLATGFVWFIYSFISLLQFDEPASMPGLGPLRLNDAVNDWFYTALPVASIIYLSFLLLPFLQFLRNYRYVRVLRRQGLQKASADWRLFVSRVSVSMGIRKNVQIWLSEFVSSPVTIGYLKPIILLPVAALSQLTPAQAEAILLHELSHIKRYDYLINLTVRLIQSFLYFNPFARAFANIIEMEREKTCDDMVMQFQYEPHAYASALLALEKEARQLQLLTVAAFRGKKSELLIRVESIMGIKQEEKFSLAKVVNTVAGFGCCLAFFVLVMLCHPTKVQTMHGNVAGYFSPYLVYPSEEVGQLRTEQAPISVIHQASVALVPSLRETEVAKHAANHEAEEGGEDYNEDQGLMFASLINDKLELDSMQQVQVEVAMETSRKVLEEIKWKDVEQNIADAMTMAQKEVAKQVFKEKTAQIDWVQLEEKLKTGYSKIDWNAINKNLSDAIIQIKYDSVQHVYSIALNELHELP